MDFEKPDWLTQMEEILETLNEGVMVADDCHRIMFVNSAFVEMTGDRTRRSARRTNPPNFIPSTNGNF